MQRLCYESSKIAFVSNWTVTLSSKTIFLKYLYSDWKICVLMVMILIDCIHSTDCTTCQRDVVWLPNELSLRTEVWWNNTCTTDTKIIPKTEQRKLVALWIYTNPNPWIIIHIPIVTRIIERKITKIHPNPAALYIIMTQNT